MKKALVLQSIVGMMLVVLAVGCATGGGMSDPDAVKAALEGWKTATMSGDVNKIMATISEKFKHTGYDYEAATKADLKTFMDGMIKEGNLKDADITTTDADVEIKGTEAVVYPIDFANNFGAVTIELTLTKEGKAWMITDMLIEGL